MKPKDWEKLKEVMIGAAISIAIMLGTGSPGMRNLVLLGAAIVMITVWYIYDKWMD